MSERPPQQPDQPEPNPDQLNPDQPNGPWDPAEQIGDIYDVDIGPSGQIESATKLEPDTQSTGPDGGPDPSENDETEPQEQPRIWVGSLLDYNNAILHVSAYDLTCRSRYDLTCRCSAS